MEVEELNKIFKILSDYYTFLGTVWYSFTLEHVVPSCSAKKKDVIGKKREYRVIIKKGNSYREVIKVILPNVKILGGNNKRML
jgi:hypothetical protein